MQAWGIAYGHQLTVEITESMMMEHDTEIFKRIQICVIWAWVYR